MYAVGSAVSNQQALIELFGGVFLLCACYGVVCHQPCRSIEPGAKHQLANKMVSSIASHNMPLVCFGLSKKYYAKINTNQIKVRLLRLYLG